MKLKKQLKHNKKNGAGFVLYKLTDGGYKVIVLIKPNGKFDIPKGHCDDSDLNKFVRAQRECFEETGIFITKNDLLCEEVYTDNGLTIFCAKTDQDPTISENPETGKIEHIGHVLLSVSGASEILPKYLSKAVKWSSEVARLDT